ncbi:MAG: addiction module protein [Acidobacteriota bacterium]|nr:addiction module protein [Acidobacteriota bacterium]
MPVELMDVRQQALKLASADRQALIHTLIASLETPELTEVDEAWLDLADTRLQEIENGIETIPGNGFFADIKRNRVWQE